MLCLEFLNFWEQKFLLKNNQNFSQDNSSMKQGPIYFHIWNKFSNTNKWIENLSAQLFTRDGCMRHLVSGLYGTLRWSSLSNCPRSHSVTSSDDTSVKRWSQSQLTSSYQEEKRQTCWNIISVAQSSLKNARTAKRETKRQMPWPGKSQIQLARAGILARMKCK